MSRGELVMVAFEEELRKKLMDSSDVGTEEEYTEHVIAADWYRTCAPVRPNALPTRPIYELYRRRNPRRVWHDFEPCTPTDPQIGSRLIGVFPVLEIPDPEGDRLRDLLESDVDPFFWLKEQLEEHWALAKVVRPIADEISGLFLFLDLRKKNAVKHQDEHEAHMKLAFGGR